MAGNNHDNMSTYLSTDSVADFMRLLRRYPPADQATNLKLFEEFKNGSLEARDQIILRNVRLVASHIYRLHIKTGSLEFSDLLSEGISGLMRSIEDYDPEKGAFSTYASQWIDIAIRRALDNYQDEIRLPVSTKVIIRKYKRYIYQCDSNGEPIPGDEELMDILGISKEMLEICKNYEKLVPISMNAKVKDEEDTELEHFIPSEEQNYRNVLDNMVDKELMAYLKLTLSPRDYYILFYRILTDRSKTLEELAGNFNLTRERIRQIEKKILNKVKMGMKLHRQNRSIRALRQHEDLDHFKVEPVEIDVYVTYLFLKSYLTKDEKSVYKVWYFRTYNYKDEYFASKLGLDLDYYKKVRSNIKKKIKYVTKNKYFYNKIKSLVLKEYGSDILTIDLDEADVSFLLDFIKSEEVLNTCSLEDLESYVDENEIDVPDNIRSLIRDYYRVPKTNNIYAPAVNRDVNMAIYGFKRNSLPFNCLYQTFKEHKNEFSDDQKRLINAYMDSIRYNRDFSSYEGYSSSGILYLIERLEKLYFGYSTYLTYNFSKEKYRILREMYLGKMSKEDINILDRFYLKGLSTEEIAQKLGISSVEAHDKLRNAREKVLALELNRKTKKEVDPKIYVAILENEEFKTDEKNRNIALSFYKDGMTYEEIGQKYGMTKRQVSNVITNLLWNMDFYRFGLVQKRKYDPSIIESLLDSYSEIEQKIIRLVLNGTGYSEFEEQYNYDQDEVKRIMKKFYLKCYKRSIEKVKVTIRDIKCEVLAHPTKNILRDNERQYFALKYGIKCEFNPNAKKHSLNRILRIMGLKPYQLNKIINAGLESVAGKKLGLVRSNLDCIDIEELEQLLKDKRIPINNKDKSILCSIYGICGKDLMTIEEVATQNLESELSIKRRILRSLVTLKRYQNGEVEKSILYSEDVEPYLKYFSISDREVLNLKYRDNKSYTEIAKLIGLTNNQVSTLLLRLEVFLKSLKENQIVGVDFDYFYKTVDKPGVPFYGDKELAKKIFHMYYEERKSAPKIIEELNLSFKQTSLFRILDNLVLAVYKYRVGIRKSVEYSYEEIRKFFLENQESMLFNQKVYYLRYFERAKNDRIPFSAHRQTSPQIILDMIKSRNQYFFDLNSSTKEEALNILRDYRNQLDSNTIDAIMLKHDIKGSDLMSGSNKKKILRGVSFVLEKSMRI